MGQSISYTIAGRHFPTQSELESVVRYHLSTSPLDEPFQDALLRDVINSLDERIRTSGQQASGLFERLSIEEQQARTGENRGYPVLMAEFDPSGRWLPVSAYPWRRRPRDYRGEIKEALRELAEMYLPPASSVARCAVQGCAIVGNVRPCYLPERFEKIAEECLDLMSAEEIETRFGFNRFSVERDNLVMLLPAAHPAVRHLLRHRPWEWRCLTHAQAVPVSREPGPICFTVSEPRKRTLAALKACGEYHGVTNPVEALKRVQEANERARRRAERSE